MCGGLGGNSLDQKRADFVEKVRAGSQIFGGRLDLLNRGQRWVIRKIEEKQFLLLATII